MDLDSYFKIGYVLKPHGLKGEVTISLDDVDVDFLSVESVFLERNKQLVPYFIENISLKYPRAYLKFDDIDSADAALEISKHAIYLPKSERPKSGRGEFYDDEIVGFEVTDEEAGVLGIITEVMSAGPNRLLVLKNNGKEVLIPVNSPFVKGVNKSKRKVTVHLPEGFLDI
jgi:16S rRNA processing protein RimM